jgi:hypothetical protein
MGPQAMFATFEEHAENSRRRALVEKLREQYAEARELVPSARGPVSSHSNLEWILGPRRNPELDGSELDGAVSELVVLWLEDLALELEAPEWPRSSSDAGGRMMTIADADARQSVAQTLRTATRDFAATLLAPRGRSASGS